MTSHAVFPERYVTTLSSVLNCYWAPARLTAAAGNYFSLPISNVVTPFNGPLGITLAPGATYASNASLVQGCSVTQNYMGYSSIATLYTNYKVMSYRVKLTAIPQNVQDTLELVILPVGFEEIPSTSAGSVNTRVLAAQPFCKTNVCEATVAAKYNSVTLVGNCWNMAGQRKEMYIDQPPTAVGAGPAAPLFVGVFLQQVNGTNNVATVTMAIEIEVLVEFTDLLNPIN